MCKQTRVIYLGYIMFKQMQNLRETVLHVLHHLRCLKSLVFLTLWSQTRKIPLLTRWEIYYFYKDTMQL